MSKYTREQLEAMVDSGRMDEILDDMETRAAAGDPSIIVRERPDVRILVETLHRPGATDADLDEAVAGARAAGRSWDEISAIITDVRRQQLAKTA